MTDYTTHIAPANQYVGEQDVSVCNGCGAGEPETIADHVPGCAVAMKEWRASWRVSDA